MNIITVERKVMKKNDELAAENRERFRQSGTWVLNLLSSPGAGKTTLLKQTVRRLDGLELATADLLFIENVGNLVCPAGFDLGEDAKVVIASTTEGDDKPEKYPNVFRVAQACVLNKVDLLPHVDFDVERFRTHALNVNPALRFFETSARTGEGLDAWCA